MFYVFLCNDLSNGYTKSIIVTDMNPMWLTGVKAPTKLTNLAFTGTRQSWEAIFFLQLSDNRTFVTDRTIYLRPETFDGSQIYEVTGHSVPIFMPK